LSDKLFGSATAPGKELLRCRPAVLRLPLLPFLHPDEDYQREKTPLQRALKLIDTTTIPKNLPNLEHAAQLLKDLPAL